MVIKLKVTRHVEKKKKAPTRLVIERVVSKPALAKKPLAKKVSAKKPTVKKAVTKRSVIKPLTQGTPFPEFSLLSTLGDTISKTSLLGERYVLYFYPKDMTSGCTTEAREFSDLAVEFTAKQVNVFGVSADSLQSHMHFIESANISFPLLVDEAHMLADACGVWSRGMKRTTFVIGPDGIIERVYATVKAPGHAVCVLKDLSK